MIGISSKEKAKFFNISKGIRSFLDIFISGNVFILLTGVLRKLINRSIDPLDDGPAQYKKTLSVLINFRPAARPITGNVFSKTLKIFFEKMSGDLFSNVIFFHAKYPRMSLFPADTSPGVKCSTGSIPQKSSKHSGMRIIKRAKRLISPESFLNNNSDKFILSSVRQPGICFSVSEYSR